jgi:hypothetical protein
MEAVHDPRARLRRMHEVLLERRPATEMRASAARPLRCCMRLVQRVWGGSYLAGPASGNPTADASDFKSHWAVREGEKVSFINENTPRAPTGTKNTRKPARLAILK